MKEIFSKFPDMIETLLQKSMESTSARERPEVLEAKKKLMGKLRRINSEIKTLSQQNGPTLTEKQQEELRKNLTGPDLSFEQLKLAERLLNAMHNPRRNNEAVSEKKEKK